jgi:hypothetical protein
LRNDSFVVSCKTWFLLKYIVKSQISTTMKLDITPRMFNKNPECRFQDVSCKNMLSIQWSLERKYSQYPLCSLLNRVRSFFNFRKVSIFLLGYAANFFLASLNFECHNYIFYKYSLVLLNALVLLICCCEHVQSSFIIDILNLKCSCYFLFNFIQTWKKSYSMPLTVNISFSDLVLFSSGSDM